MVSRVQTKWGYILPEGLYRLKQGHKEAVERGATEFEIDGHPYLTTFAGYLIEYCAIKGLEAVPTESNDPVFVP
jgi:hypothetical protein